MEQIILIVHVLAALGIVALILIQRGKGADAGASFGAGASQTVFGSSGGGNVLTKTTAVFATIFFATSFGLAILAKNKAELAGGINIDLPAVVETIAAPASVTDIPSVDEDGFGVADQVPSEAVDVPAAELEELGGEEEVPVPE